MKLIHAILVGAASLLPTALAQTPAGDAKPFVITVNSDASPISHVEYRYPSYAGVRGLEGACDVTFAISTAGKADAIRVGACTSDVFRGAAKKTIEGMSFSPRASVTTGATATVRWAIQSSDPRVKTASLD
jgi:outer membrane biosynthesis protein TonB